MIMMWRCVRGRRVWRVPFGVWRGRRSRSMLTGSPGQLGHAMGHACGLTWRIMCIMYNICIAQLHIALHLHEPHAVRRAPGPADTVAGGGARRIRTYARRTRVARNGQGPRLSRRSPAARRSQLFAALLPERAPPPVGPPWRETRSPDADRGGFRPMHTQGAARQRHPRCAPRHRPPRATPAFDATPPSLSLAGAISHDYPGTFPRLMLFPSPRSDQSGTLATPRHIHTHTQTHALPAIRARSPRAATGPRQ